MYCHFEPLSTPVGDRGEKVEDKRPEFVCKRTLMGLGMKERLLKKIRNHTEKGYKKNPFSLPPALAHSKSSVAQLLGLSQNPSY